VIRKARFLLWPEPAVRSETLRSAESAIGSVQSWASWNRGSGCTIAGAMQGPPRTQWKGGT